MYRTQQFADRAGVTVRALHHYDRLGLLKPRRSAAGYRLYEDRDLERLEQITALKFLGLPLIKIRTLLDGASETMPRILARQRCLLLEKRRTLDRAIQAITEAESQNGAIPALRKIIEVIEMETSNDWMDKYHTEESKAKVDAQRHEWSPELQQSVSRQWAELIAEVESAAGRNEDPASETAQSLAARWKALVEAFTKGDAAVTASVGRMWADRANWPKAIDHKAPRIGPEVYAFTAKANAAKKV